MSLSGSTVATANEPSVNSRMTATDAISMAMGNCRFGSAISLACTACTSTPANSRMMPARKAISPRPVMNGKYRGCAWPPAIDMTEAESVAAGCSIAIGLPWTIQITARTMMITPGSTVPARNAQLVTFAMALTPCNVIQVAAQ